MLHLSLQQVDHATGQQPNRAGGEAVVLAVGQSRVRCIAIRASGETVLVPCSADADILAGISEFPQTARVEWPGGTTSSFDITRMDALKCIVGTAGAKEPNRRRSRRIRLEFTAAISENGTDWNFTTGHDISRGGALVAVGDLPYLRSGATVHFRLKMPDDVTVAGRALVARSTAIATDTGTLDGVGLRFTHMRLNDSHRLAEFIQDWLSSHGQPEQV